LVNLFDDEEVTGDSCEGYTAEGAGAFEEFGFLYHSSRHAGLITMICFARSSLPAWISVHPWPSVV